MRDVYFAEEGFGDWMHQVVEPYLEEHCGEGYFWSQDGVSIHYKQYRLETAEKCVVISHGFCEFAEKYNEFIYYLLQNGVSVYIAEHRGHGYSGRRVSDPEMIHVADYQEYVKDFVRFVESVVVPKEEHRILFAHSMGGAVAAFVLEQYPQLFERAILSSPMCRMQTGRYPTWLAGGIAGFCRRIGRGASYAPGQGGFRETPDFEGSSCLSRARYEYIFEKRLENDRYRTYGGSYAWVHAGIKAGRKLMKKSNLRKIKIPLLVFAAGCDHMVDNDAIAQFVNGIQQAELIVVHDAKHEIFHAGITVRRNYYEKIFTFLEKEDAYEGENEQIRKILGTL